MADSYLNKSGLSYFWDKIDNKKQNKLTPGSNITISGDTISASQPTVNNGKLTIQKNGSNVGTFTANQSTNVTANITVPTKTSDITNDSNFVTSSGTVAKANQLTTPRTIGISGGATGTATSFNGTANISIPITDVKDSYVTWGGKPLYSTVSPDDAGCIDEFGHNKLAFLPANCIQVHYSTDGGSTWTDYGLTDAQKIQLVTYGDVFCKTGGTTAATSSNITNLKLRIRIATAASTTTTGTGSLYTDWRKVLLNVNDPNSNCNMTMRYRTIANYKSGTETWVDSGTTYPVRGGTAWNSIPRPSGWPAFGGNYANQTSQIGQLEFVLSNTKLGTWGDKKGSICSIRMIGMSNWAMPSEMARTGRPYTIDTYQSVTFPNEVSSGRIYLGTSQARPKQAYAGTVDLGASGIAWRNLYLDGDIYNGSYALSLPDKTGTIALISDIPSTDQIITIEKTLAGNTSWTNTGIAGPDLETGTYIIQALVGPEGGSFASLWSERWSGIMSWYASNTNNTNSDEIILHNSGHADNDNDFFLRTKHDGETRSGTKYLSLQYAFKNSNANSATVTFKFRRMI